METSSQAAPTLSRVRCEREQKIGAAGFEKGVLDQGAGGDDTDNFPADRAFAGARPGVFHLLGDGDTEAAAYQASEVGVGGVDRDAAHRDGIAGMLAAGGEGDVEGGRGGFRIGEEQFVEVAHAEEQKRVRVIGLHGEPLGHDGGGAGGIRAGEWAEGLWGGHRRSVYTRGSVEGEGWETIMRRMLPMYNGREAAGGVHIVPGPTESWRRARFRQGRYAPASRSRHTNPARDIPRILRISGYTKRRNLRGIVRALCNGRGKQGSDLEAFPPCRRGLCGGKGQMKVLNTLTAYVIGVLIVWAVIFAVGYFRCGSTPGYPLLHVFGGFMLGMLSM